jgi:hypothetical protein
VKPAMTITISPEALEMLRRSQAATVTLLEQRG